MGKAFAENSQGIVSLLIWYFLGKSNTLKDAVVYVDNSYRVEVYLYSKQIALAFY